MNQPLLYAHAPNFVKIIFAIHQTRAPKIQWKRAWMTWMGLLIELMGWLTELMG
jgi:hypothetical protein